MLLPVGSMLEGPRSDLVQDGSCETALGEWKSIAFISEEVHKYILEIVLAFVL